MHEAWLNSANLASANLFNAKLQKALLRSANFEQADLRLANFEQADLSHAKFYGASLLEANLCDAVLWEAQFDQSSIMPNGANWSLETDLDLFTDPLHPQFWRSSQSNSPAYREQTNNERQRLNFPFPKRKNVANK